MGRNGGGRSGPWAECDGSGAACRAPGLAPEDCGGFSLDGITEPDVIVLRQLAGGEVVIEITQLAQQLATAIVIRSVGPYVQAAARNRERPQDQQPDKEGQPAADEDDGHPGSSSRSRATAFATARRSAWDSRGESASGGSGWGVRSQRRSSVNAVIKPAARTSNGR